MSPGSAFLSAFTPSLMSQEALEAIFVQKRRHDLLERLIDDVDASCGATSKHHTLLVGPRGIGKTHLITMLYHRLRNNSENAPLDARLRIAWLKEEERGVPTFGHLVRRMLQRLAEEYKDDSLRQGIETLQDFPSEFEARAAEMLTRWIGEHTLLLMMENFQDVLHRMGPQGQRALRAYLQNHKNVLLLATTPSLTLALTEYEAPFYGFFNVETLYELEEADALELLQNIAEWRKDADLAAFLKTQTARNRIRVIEALAGGHPRIWILFAGVLTRQALDETVPLFLEMLDDLTPYYQSRLDALSPQQAQVMECLIEKGRSVPVWEIARHCLMEPNSVSVQLRLLGEMGYIKSDRIGRIAYNELREPLMRLCLEVKSSRGKPLQILVEFLRRWYDRSELQQRLANSSSDSLFEQMHLKEAIEQTRKSFTDAETYERVFVNDPGCTYDVFSKAVTYCSMGMWEECLSHLRHGFSAKDFMPGKDAWVGHGRYISQGLIRLTETIETWPVRVATLVQLYDENGVLAEVGTGIVEMLPDLLTPVLSDYTVDAFNAAFQSAGKGHEEWEIPLRLLDAAVRWRKTRDPAVLLSLRAEERAVLIEALSLMPEETRADSSAGTGIHFRKGRK